MLIILLEPIGAHGGMLNFDLAFCRALSNHDLELIWATSDETEVIASSFEFWTPLQKIYGSMPAWRRGLNYAHGLWRVLLRAYRESRSRPVIIHQQFITFLPFEWVFVSLARLCGISCVLTPHDTVPFNSSSMTRRLLPSFYRRFDAIISHTRDSLPALQQQTADKGLVHYIAHGNFNQNYQSHLQLSQADARSQLELADETSVIAFLGSIRKEKGLEFLIAAMPIILREIPDAILLIAGRPWKQGVELYEQMIDRLALWENVRVRWGYVLDEEFPLYFRAADVVALPYTHVFQSGVIMTAYALRRPVVASQVGGLVEQVLDGETGYLVPAKDSKALAVAITKILKEPGLATSMGQAGYDWASAAGDWRRIAAQTVQVYLAAWQRRHGERV